MDLFSQDYIVCIYVICRICDI